MASKRQGRAKHASSVDSGTGPAEAPVAADWPPSLVAALIGLALLAAIHVAMWYDLFGLGSGQPDDAGIVRRTALLLVVSPDRMLEMWCGNSFAYFSILDRLPVVMVVVAILVGAWLSGGLALQLLGVTRLLGRLEQAVFATAVGLNLLSLYALAVGLAGGLRLRWLFIGPLAGLFVYGVVSAVRGWSAHASRDPEPSASPDERRWMWWLLVAAPFAAVMVLGAMLPPYEYDVREYHLQVPKEWFLQGRITFLPHNIYGNMPLGSELTALWGMALMGGDDAWWWGAIVGKTLMACFSLVTIAGLVAFGHRTHSTAAGVLAAVAYASTPWITQVSIIGYNEGPAGLYFLCAIYACWLAWKNQQPADANRLIALSGFLAGAAVACKYPPALFLVVPLAAWVAISRYCHATACLPGASSAAPRRVVSTVLSLVLFLTGVAAGCGPWLAKNAALTGNPTYPLLVGVFDGATRTPEKDEQWKRAFSAAGRPRSPLHIGAAAIRHRLESVERKRGQPRARAARTGRLAGQRAAPIGGAAQFVGAVCAGDLVAAHAPVGSVPRARAADRCAAGRNRRGGIAKRSVAEGDARLPRSRRAFAIPSREFVSRRPPLLCATRCPAPRRPADRCDQRAANRHPAPLAECECAAGRPRAACWRCRAVRSADAGNLQHLFRRLPVHAAVCRPHARRSAWPHCRPRASRTSSSRGPT